MRWRSGFHVVPLLAVAAVLATVACGTSSPKGFDYGIVDEDVPSEDAPVEEATGGLRVVITNPPEGGETRVSGAFELGVRVDDEQNRAITLKVEVPRAPTFAAITQELSGPKSVSIPVDTALIPDGRKWTMQVTATTSDGGSASASVKLTVDNTGPDIVADEPTPAEGGNFLGDLKVRFKVKDPGAGVSQILIEVEKFSYTWPPSGTQQAQVEVDTGVIPIPTADWEGGPKELKVTAYDGIEGHETVRSWFFSYVQRPNFEGGSVYALPADFTGGVAVAGVRLEDGSNGAVVAGSSGLAIFTRDALTESLARRAELAKSVSCTHVDVRDMNLDGLDDIVAFCPTWLNETTNMVVMYFQAAGGLFDKPVTLAAPALVKAMAIGNLNYDTKTLEDSLPDLAFALADTAGLTVGVALSDNTGEAPVWGPILQYSGAQQPTLVAIGRFVAMPATNPYKNAVLVGREGSGIVTLFPMDPFGKPSAGINSLLEIPKLDGTGLGPAMNLSAAGAVAFDSLTAEPGTVVFGDGATGRVFTAFKNPNSNTFQADTLYLAGMNPQKVLAADFDSDGTNDVAVLCKGGNQVQVFRGTNKSGPNSANNLLPGPSYLSGPAADLASVDLDGDGSRDLLVLSADGLKLTWIRWDGDAARFVGAPMVLIQRGASAVVPLSMAVGRFTVPETDARTLQDVAVLGVDLKGDNSISFYVSDRNTGLATVRAESAPILVELSNPQRIVAANLDQTAAKSGGPDDLVLTAAFSGPTSGERLPTAVSYLFRDDTEKHTIVGYSPHPFYAGEAPSLVAAGDFDWSRDGAKPGYIDLAFVTGFYDEDGKRIQELAMFLGDGKGTSFVDMADPGAGGGVHLKVPEAKQPKALIAAPTRQNLQSALANPGKQVARLDFLTANAGTGDFSIYPNQGDGVFDYASRIRDFAIGANVKSVAVGFLSVPLDGSVPDSEAKGTLPDVVTLLDQEVFVSYNTSPYDQLATDPSKVSFAPPRPLGHKGNGPVEVALANMNNDSHLDIIVLNAQDASVTVYLNLGSRAFSQPFTFSTGVDPIGMAVKDMDGNGCPDIVTADRGGKTLTFLKNAVPCNP